MVPETRIQLRNTFPIQASKDYVLYWMVAFRRTNWNFSLQRAVDWALQLKKPLVIFEPLRVDYQWASDRLHRFAIDGMSDNATRIASLKNLGILYWPYVEPSPKDDVGLLDALADRACVVITDDFPSFFLPKLILIAASRLQVRLECIDSNGMFPMRVTDRIFTTAFSFRAFLQKELLKHLTQLPVPDPLSDVILPALTALPGAITKRWRPASKKLLAGDASELARLKLDHSVGIVDYRGGATTARLKLEHFLTQHLEHYADESNEPDDDVRSGLSPYLHFGHISAHEIFAALMSNEDWSPEQLSKATGGKREGWWNVSPSAESWLDELITWRELGYNLSSHCDNYTRYDSLPEWAKSTLDKHTSDRRETIYSLDEFTEARTHDPLWNAAQSQLLHEGRIHNYLRMLWGKKILEWTATPREALKVMIELNNRYAVDGRDPNSYSGIFWVLGRYDRAWGPERPIFGTVRYMSSDNTRKKLRVKEYLQKWSFVQNGGCF